MNEATIDTAVMSVTASSNLVTGNLQRPDDATLIPAKT